MSQRLGDLLVREKVITAEQLDQAVKMQKDSGTRLGAALVIRFGCLWLPSCVLIHDVCGDMCET